MMSDVRKDYVDAVIRLQVPKWQIGEECFVYFKDTMSIKGICQSDTTPCYPLINGTRYCVCCGRLFNELEQQHFKYCPDCGVKIWILRETNND